MERNQEFMINDNYDLTYEAWLSGEGSGDTLSILYPKIPGDYFKDKDNPLVPIRWKPRRSLMPYFIKRDLNKMGDDESINKPKYAYEIGIKGTF